jgi:hypothetical protein
MNKSPAYSPDFEYITYSNTQVSSPRGTLLLQSKEYSGQVTTELQLKTTGRGEGTEANINKKRKFSFPEYQAKET